MNGIDKSLKKLDIERAKEFSLGKKMSNYIWVHKNYIEEILPVDISFFKESLDFDVVRINTKNLNEISFIKVEDFDKQNEPIIQKSYTVKDINQPEEIKVLESGNNPLIYHHKWLMVKDDYTGFDVAESKIRSLVWKKELGINKEISSQIGRLNFWNQWLLENKIEEKIELEKLNISTKKDYDTSLWIFSKNNDLIMNQSIKSEKTSKKAKNGVPYTATLVDKLNLWKPNTKHLDIGCGVYFYKDEYKFKSFLESKGIQAFGFDPYNQSFEVNKNTVLNCQNKQCDSVSINNVLNTIKENDVIKHILLQAKNALKSDGRLFVLIHEGDRKSIETPTRDGWQKNKPTKEYLELVKEVFPNCIVKENMIIASPSLTLELLPKSKKNTLK